MSGLKFGWALRPYRFGRRFSGRILMISWRRIATSRPAGTSSISTITAVELTGICLHAAEPLGRLYVGKLVVLLLKPNAGNPAFQQKSFPVITNTFNTLPGCKGTDCYTYGGKLDQKDAMSVCEGRNWTSLIVNVATRVMIKCDPDDVIERLLVY